MRVWLNEASSEVHKADLNETSELLLAAYYRGPSGLTIGYTLNELRTFCRQANLVTTATDYSVVLWTFVIDALGDFTFLLPLPNQRYVISY